MKSAIGFGLLFWIGLYFLTTIVSFDQNKASSIHTAIFGEYQQPSIPDLLASGNARLIGQKCAGEVSLTLPSIQNVFYPIGAIKKLEKFFAQYPPKRFEILHEGQTKSHNGKYIIGLLHTKNGKVFLSLIHISEPTRPY